jgi:hypothetical protein
MLHLTRCYIYLSMGIVLCGWAYISTRFIFHWTNELTPARVGILSLPRHTNPYASLIRDQLLEHQALECNIAPHRSGENGITIAIRNNSISKVFVGGKHGGWHHAGRRQQYMAMFQDMLKVYGVVDSNVNINLQDRPVRGHFNFCRERGATSQFLLPNMRFVADDIFRTRNFNNDSFKSRYFN